MVSKSHAMANNPHVGNFDREQPISNISHCNANNRYGWAMSQFLPMSGFFWVGKVKWQRILCTELRDEENVIYILECDLENPTNLTTRKKIGPSPHSARTN